MIPLEREEFELVAKVCGFRVNFSANGTFVFREQYPGNWVEWNPKTNDGDALRLAVKLKMTLKLTEYGAAARIGDDFAATRLVATDEVNSVEAATRLAIWRAAVEYARSLK